MKVMIILYYIINSQTIWRKKLMMKFKNLRRSLKSEATEQAEDEPPRKKRSLSNKRLYFPPDGGEEEEDIENAKAALKEAWSKNKAKNKKLIMQLYKATSKDRFKWIQESGPTALEVIAKYPMIRKSRLVSYVKLKKIVIYNQCLYVYSYGLISSKFHHTKEHWITLVKSGRNL